MFTAILWDYDGTLANTPVKNIAVTRAVLGRLDPALLDPLPEALPSLAAYQAANYRWRTWRELYRHALPVPVDRLDGGGAGERSGARPRRGDSLGGRHRRRRPCRGGRVAAGFRTSSLRRCAEEIWGVI